MRKNFLSPCHTTQMGFSMLPVFMIMIAMAGAAILAISHTQNSLRHAAAAREHAVARYAAEAAISEGKALMLNYWSDTVMWTNLLLSPPAESGSYKYFIYGGSGGIPQVKARYRFLYRNNPGDPSGSTTDDQDGRVLIYGIGEYLDPASSSPKILGRTVIALEVYRQDVLHVSNGYRAQAMGGAGHAGFTNFDLNGVSFTNVVSF